MAVGQPESLRHNAALIEAGRVGQLFGDQLCDHSKVNLLREVLGGDIDIDIADARPAAFVAADQVIQRARPLRPQAELADSLNGETHQFGKLGFSGVTTVFAAKVHLIVVETAHFSIHILGQGNRAGVLLQRT